MRQLYIDRDLFCIIKEHILPCLEENKCELRKYLWRKDIDAMRCLDKTLNKKIHRRPLNKCKYLELGSKRVCGSHCRALAIYKHLKRRRDEHKGCKDLYIHFKKPEVFGYALANLYKDQYRNTIATLRGKLRGCCHSDSGEWSSGWRTKKYPNIRAPLKYGGW